MKSLIQLPLRNDVLFVRTNNSVSFSWLLLITIESSISQKLHSLAPPSSPAPPPSPHFLLIKINLI
ncbi:hypothetical protein NC652_017127 [Populus alba x Populus x berolinensis]|nr:hypothetical protein NC652_017127 [Populus alba x Populus x berolinensis]